MLILKKAPIKRIIQRLDTSTNLPIDITIIDFPELRQTYNYTCGASALQSILDYFGIDVREDILMEKLKTDPQNGTETFNIIAVAKEYGLMTKAGKFTIDDLKTCINKGWPVLITLQAWSDLDMTKSWTEGHYCIAIGFSEDKIIFEDPASENRTYLTYDELNSRWHDVGSDITKKLYNWGCVFYGKKPQFQTRTIEHMD